MDQRLPTYQFAPPPLLYPHLHLVDVPTPLILTGNNTKTVRGQTDNAKIYITANRCIVFPTTEDTQCRSSTKHPNNTSEEERRLCGR